MYKKYFKESIESRELMLYITNDGDLYRQATSIINNMKKKLKAGKFDANLAVKGFFYLADAGAKKYEKDYGEKGMFSKADKMETAKELLDYYMEEIKESYKEECDCGGECGCHNELDEDQKRCDDLGKDKGRKYKYDGGSCSLQSCGNGETWNDDRTRCVKKESSFKEEGRSTLVAPDETSFLKVANSDKVKQDISDAGFPSVYLFNPKVKYVLFLINNKDIPEARKIKGVKDYDRVIMTVGEWKLSPFSGEQDSDLLSKFKKKNGK